MKITDIRCAIIGRQPTIRIVTDTEHSGYGAAELAKTYIAPYVMFYKDYLIGQDPRNVAQVMQRIRRMGSYKPWGSAISGIEMALWDLAGKAADLPIHRLLGGKVRDRVRVYHTAAYGERAGCEPEDYARTTERFVNSPEGFTIMKHAVGFHSTMPSDIPGFFYGDPRTGAPHPNAGLLTEAGLHHMVNCVEAMVDAASGKVGIALDCGPGWTVPDAIRFGKALEKYHIMWMEDLLTGDYTPYVGADDYREVTQATSTPTHTGEQIYLRQNFRELIEKRAVRVIGPDPLDVGGLAELKWVAEYADMHGILMAPHGIGDGLLGLAALVQVSATLPDNFIAFECPVPPTEWWSEIVDGMPEQLISEGHIAVPDLPGLGLNLNPEKASRYLDDADRGFFD
ncbi:MAG: mandelate racemase/muconate lactonizing enzyme family protein [Spirochaetales bacterium]|nr:MAG: mandelate racemase/muconate lactonizing enzyme family protein [Spirochaetales bacterium]